MFYRDYRREKEREMSKNNSSSGGIGFLGLLAIVFITLKLMGVITWSWLWVTAPLWGSLILGILVVCVVAVFGIMRNRKGR